MIPRFATFQMHFPITFLIERNETFFEAENMVSAQPSVTLSIWWYQRRRKELLEESAPRVVWVRFHTIYSSIDPNVIDGEGDTIQ